VGLDIPVIPPGGDIPAGSIITGFQFVTPVADDVCNEQIASSLKRNLPEAVTRKKLNIIAGGPSASDVNLWNLEGPTLALNSAMRLFKNGLYPTYWAACDPQEEVAGLIPDNPPDRTTYFLANKCHPNLFRKLQGRDVRLWHLKDYEADGKSRIALCSSITMCAAWLMHRLGYTDFEFYGWDGCYMDGRHHATVDDDWSEKEVLTLNYGGDVSGDEVIGGRNFQTTRTWAAEAQGAQQFFQLADYFDIGINIHGDGMIAHVHQLMSK